MILKFLKKQWSNILLLFFIIILIVPQWRFPFQVELQRLLSFSPSISQSSVNEKVNLNEFTLRPIDDSNSKVSPRLNQVTIINFWATWCPPCVAEMPSFQKLYNDYGEHVQFIFISQESNLIQRNFLNSKNLNLPSYRPYSDIPKGLESDVLPTTYILDENGEVLLKKTGSANWNASRFRKQLDALLF